MKTLLTLILMIPFLCSCNFMNSKKQNDWDNKSDTIFRYNLFDTSMKENVSCYRIPSMVTAKNGDLIAVIDERVSSCGDLKWNKNINISIRRSSDQGKTWTPIQVIVDFPFGQSASDPSMVVDEKTGEIFLFYNYMDLDKEKDIYYFHVISSVDNGKTWGTYRDITPMVTTPDMKNDFKFITSGRGLYTSDEKILHTIVNIQKGLFVFGSNDHGKTWNFINHPVTPADESKIVELSDGRWMINSRVNELGMRYVHVSNDHGKSWVSNPDSVLIDPGCNGSIIKYSSVKDGDDKDRLILSNISNDKDRKRLTVRLSYDNGKTWSFSKDIYSGGAAYSSLTVLKDGDIAVFYEKDDYQKNEFAKFSLTWLTDGKDSYKK